jgi:GT2 family glycosyltransferase
MTAERHDLSVVVANYNGGEVLVRTVETLQAVLGEQTPIIVADDGSEDGRPDRIRRRFPTVRVLSPGGHTGRPTVVRNVGLRAVTTPFVFLTDNDILINPGSIDAMMRVLRSSESVLCCTPRLLDADDPNTIYADGNYLHYLGLSGTSRRGQRVSETPVRPPHPTFGGGIMLINMRLAAEMGYCDEGYPFGWADDAEFQLRGRVRGFQSLHVPASVCLHVSKDHGTQRSYGQFYNRYRLLFTVYSSRALILLAPPLLLFEIALTGFAAAMGVSRERWRAIKQIWRDRAEIRAMRAVNQATRRVKDSAVLEGGGIELGGPMARSGALSVLTRLAAGALDLYWRLVRGWL